MRAAFLLLPFLAAACAVPAISPERAAQICEERARDAMGPSGKVTVGVNSNTGPFIGGQIRLTSDYIEGRDPQEVYETCVMDYTGQPPYRQPNLGQE